jgi:hypothetical protein
VSIFCAANDHKNKNITIPIKGMAKVSVISETLFFNWYDEIVGIDSMVATGLELDIIFTVVRQKLK